MFNCRFFSISLLAALILSVSNTVVPARGATEHPVVIPMPGAELDDALSKTVDFASYEFRVSTDSGTEVVVKEGRYWFLKYRINKPNGRLDTSVSADEIVANHKAAVQEKGGTIHYDKNRKLTFSVPREGGGTTWAHLMASDGRYDIHIVDVAKFEKQLNFGAQEMAEEMDRAGMVRVYGIHFNVDDDSLLPGAEKVLVELVRLMQLRPNLRVEISGHTDSTGDTGYNEELSRRRAGTVASFLKLYGIDSKRLVTVGYGESMPVATNDTEEGRALNRRVELKRIE